VFGRAPTGPPWRTVCVYAPDGSLFFSLCALLLGGVAQMRARQTQASVLQLHGLFTYRGRKKQKAIPPDDEYVSSPHRTLPPQYVAPPTARLQALVKGRRAELEQEKVAERAENKEDEDEEGHILPLGEPVGRHDQVLDDAAFKLIRDERDKGVLHQRRPLDPHEPVVDLVAFNEEAAKEHRDDEGDRDERRRGLRVGRQDGNGQRQRLGRHRRDKDDQDKEEKGARRCAQADHPVEDAREEHVEEKGSRQLA